MTSVNYLITTELISDYAADRLDAKDMRVIEEVIDRDETVAAARRVNSRMIHIACEACQGGDCNHALETREITGRVSPVPAFPSASDNCRSVT